jgi:multiple sugar transport system substrate-binding protein
VRRRLHRGCTDRSASQAGSGTDYRRGGGTYHSVSRRADRGRRCEADHRCRCRADQCSGRRGRYYRSGRRAVSAAGQTQVRRVAQDPGLESFRAGVRRLARHLRQELGRDHIRNADIPARLAAEASAGAGHDLFEFQAVLQAATYKDRLVDLTDVANVVSKKYGGWTDIAKTFGVVDGKWMAMMTYSIMQPHLYRADYFKDAGYDKFPDDYPTLLEATAKLKEAGHPCGLPLSNCNDGNHNWRSVLYSFGGTEQSADGQKVTLASDETLSALKFGVELFNKGMTDEVFSWDDSGNNLMLLSGRASWVDNATSAYITARDQAPDVFAQTRIGLQPKGPGAKGGRRNGVDANAWAVWKWANDVDTAKAFIADWYDQWQEWGKVTNGYNSPPLLDMWKKPMPGLEDPNFQIMQDWREVAFVAGLQGTFNSAIEEVNATFVMPNMFARAVRGETPDAAMQWGEAEYKRIFQKHGVSNP